MVFTPANKSLRPGNSIRILEKKNKTLAELQMDLVLNEFFFTVKTTPCWNTTVERGQILQADYESSITVVL